LALLPRSRFGLVLFQSTAFVLERLRLNDSGEIVMPEPLAYFLTWTTYGTWLPGDERCWTKRNVGLRSPNPVKQRIAQSRMTEKPCLLDAPQRQLVESVIAEHCKYRAWNLHAVNCRTNHVHAVISANQIHPDRVMQQLKTWASRKLKETSNANRRKWWTERGSKRYINSLDDLEAAVLYVRDAQNKSR
jgi:REP element-mobilizing transposase RayT